MRRKDNVRRFLLSVALAALSLSACASAPPQVETITIDGEDLIMDISEEKAFSFDCQPADAQREELALKAPAQLGAELEDERIIIDPDEEGTFTLYLQSDAVTSNAITVTVIDSAHIEAEKQAEEEARRREEAERQKAQEAEAAAQAETAQQAQQEQAASQRTPASGGNAQTPGAGIGVYRRFRKRDEVSQRSALQPHERRHRNERRGSAGNGIYALQEVLLMNETGGELPVLFHMAIVSSMEKAS